MKNSALIGLFDSGVGGLTVARQLEKDLPEANFLYFGDTKYVPYGSRSAEEVIGLINKIARHMVESQVGVMVMACNTSSALAYDSVVSWCPIPVIGIIGEAAEAAGSYSKNGKIGVIANMLTAKSGAYERACQKAWEMIPGAAKPQVFPMGCPKLVPLIEAGLVDTPQAEEAVREYIEPLMANDIDTLVLGCTHYPFLQALIEKVLAGQAKVIDPAAFVATRLKKLGFGQGLAPASIHYQVSGDPLDFAKVGTFLLGQEIAGVEHVEL